MIDILIYGLPMLALLALLLGTITQTYTFTFQEGTTQISQSVTLTGIIENNLSVTVPGITTNQQEALAWTNAKLQGIYIYSDQTLTLKTNSNSAPQDTITITGGSPFVWTESSGVVNPFAGNVTTTYWTNGGTTTANLTVKTLVGA